MYDFQNYHYYNVFALFNNTDNFLVPAGVNTFFNPFFDIILYLYIKYLNNYPTIIYSLQGIWGGVLLSAAYKISMLFNDSKNLKNIGYALIVCLIITTGGYVITQIGSSTNEVAISALDLWCLYFIFKMIKQPTTQNLRQWFFIGLSMGIILGLKSTSIIICISVGLSLICCYNYIKDSFRSIILFALGGILGYLLIHGYFMWEYQEKYSNPFFPFLNGIFKSPYMEPFNYNDTACLQ